jgi:hypothetical protein
MSSFRHGIDPEKTGAGLRGIGAIVIVLAFLGVSNSFTSDNNDKTVKPTQSTTPPVVFADEALRTILPKVDGAPGYTFGTPAALRVQLEKAPAADLFISASAADVQGLIDDGKCAKGVVVVGTDPAATPPRKYTACAVNHGGVATTNAVAYLRKLDGLDARAALIDAGFDLPDR